MQNDGHQELSRDQRPLITPVVIRLVDTVCMELVCSLQDLRSFYKLFLLVGEVWERTHVAGSGW